MSKKPSTSRPPKPEQISHVGAKIEFHLTDATLRKIGEPDRRGVNSHSRTAGRTCMYNRDRIEKYVAENWEEIEKVRLRREQSPPLFVTRQEDEARELQQVFDGLLHDPQEALPLSRQQTVPLRHPVLGIKDGGQEHD